MPYKTRDCEICTKSFRPRQDSKVGEADFKRCATCRNADSSEQVFESPVEHIGAPLRQIIFDWETWGLDRGWGVSLVVSWIIFGGEHPERGTLISRDYPAWKSGRRSHDRDIMADFLKIYGGCQIAFAHNGDRFDVKWMRTVALKYGLPMPRVKLVDPCAIAWKKYLVGRNSLDALADFLGLEQRKMHIPIDIWREALLDDSDEAWRMLVARCESDVDVLTAVAGKVVGDVGMIDYSGSWR